MTDLVEKAKKRLLNNSRAVAKKMAEAEANRLEAIRLARILAMEKLRELMSTAQFNSGKTMCRTRYLLRS